MGRFSAASRGAAIFLIAICSCPLAHACEDCEARDIGKVDVTSAVDTAISFVAAAVRKLKPSYEVSIVEGEAPPTTLTVAEYAAAFDARDGQRNVELPGFRHRYEWQLTYRDDPGGGKGLAGIAQPSRSERLSGTDVTLDDSWVFGLRFELDYGWKR